MKKAIFSILACAAFVGTSIAGTEMRSSGKDYKDKNPIPEEPCFKDMEFQLDIFGSYNESVAEGDKILGDHFGGGVGANVFFHRYFGLGIEGNWFPGTKDVIHTVSGSAILRYPLEIGNHFCLAPYIIGGGGGLFDGTKVGTGHVGGGLEFRVIKNVGIFTDARYVWTGGHTENFVEIRSGVRFAF